MERRLYEIVGNPKDLDTLEKALRHIEYLGQVGASRNIMVRVDGDGSGRVKIYRRGKQIDNEKYNIDQAKLKYGCVGVYDIG